MSATVTKPESNKVWTPEQLAKHIADICGPIVAQALDPLQKRVTDYGNWIEGAKSTGGMTQQAIDRTTAQQRGLLVGGIIASLAATKGNLDAAVEHAKKVKNNEEVVRALAASTIEGGGVLVPEDVSNDFIELLTPRAVLRSFGVPVIQMPSGTMNISKINASAQAYYVGENRDIPKSQPLFGGKKMSAKKLAVLIPISNDLLRRGGPKVNALVRNDALRAMALKEDVTFLRSPGTEFTPRGLKYLALSSQTITATAGTPTLATVTADFGRLILLMEEASVAFTNPGWIFSPRTAMYLYTLRDTNGNYVFKGEMDQGRFWGYPFKKTTQIPRNLGTGGNESEIYLVDFDDLVIGQTLGLDVAVSTEAAYIESTGEMVSAFSRDQTVMRLITEHDLAVRHDESIAVLSGVTWSL